MTNAQAALIAAATLWSHTTGAIETVRVAETATDLKRYLDDIDAGHEPAPAPRTEFTVIPPDTR